MSIMRIDKFLADCGQGTRSKVRDTIKSGNVSVDGVKILKADFKIDTEKNSVTVKGRNIEYNKFVYIMMNKPDGVVSAVTDRKHKTVIDILKKEDCKKGMFPMGRLDIDTVGLLIITNNGKLCHNTLAPRKHVVKKYYVRVLGQLDGGDVSEFKNGINLDGRLLKSAKLEIINSGEQSEAYVEICEGKFHQIKKMFLKIGKKVVYLKRVKFGEIELDKNLSEGEYRYLNEEEIKLLAKYMNENEEI